MCARVCARVRAHLCARVRVARVRVVCMRVGDVFAIYDNIFDPG